MPICGLAAAEQVELIGVNLPFVEILWAQGPEQMLDAGQSGVVVEHSCLADAVVVDDGWNDIELVYREPVHSGFAYCAVGDREGVKGPPEDGDAVEH